MSNGCCSQQPGKRGTVCDLPDKWSVSLNVCDYKPNQLCVQVHDQAIEVRGEKPCADKFSEKYCMPGDVDPCTIQWEYTPDAQLVITACKKTCG